MKYVEKKRYIAEQFGHELKCQENNPKHQNGRKKNILKLVKTEEKKLFFCFETKRKNEVLK